MKTIDEHSSAGIYSAKNIEKPVHFFYEAPNAHAVSLIGDFNNWDPAANPMKQRVGGWWYIEVPLTHGHHRYCFLVDGVPALDPQANGIVRNEKGERVSLMAIS